MGRARTGGVSRARSLDLPGARPAARRSGAVIDLAQLVLRPALHAVARFESEGLEHIPAEGGFLACGNHVGPFDALAYGRLLHVSGVAPRFLVKDSLLRRPVLGPLLRATGQVPVARGTARTADALATATAALQRGEAVIVFPEGTFTRDPERWPMRGRLGAARLALATGAPLLPIACWGSEEVMANGDVLPRPRPRVRFAIGAPIPAHRRDGETQREAEVRITAELMTTIARLLGGLRGQTPPRTLHDPSADSFQPEAGIPVPPEVLARDRAARRTVRRARRRAPWEGPWHVGRLREGRRMRRSSAKEDM